MPLSERTRIAKPIMSVIQRLIYLLNARSIFAIFLRNWTQYVYSLKQRCVRKGNDTKNPSILGFFFIIERSQLNAAHAQLLEKLRPIPFAKTCRLLTIQSLEFQDIWQKKFRNRVNDLSRKIGILRKGIFYNKENDLRRITKIACVKILLKQCWQKGFNVKS